VLFKCGPRRSRHGPGKQASPETRSDSEGLSLKLSIQATAVIAAIFAAICLSVAVTGFSSLGGITDPTAAADAKGFAWFWAFLAGVATAAGLLAWRIARNHGEHDHEQGRE
jgi:hypothetical protein